jgi:hypothetical protein
MRHLFIGMSLWLIGQCPAVADMPPVPEPVYINSVHFQVSPDHTQVVFDASVQVWHKILLLRNPDRLVIDLLGGRTDTLWTDGLSGGFVEGIRTGITNDGLSLITLDLKQGVFPSSFNLKPKWHYGHRLVIDLSANVETPGGNPFRVANTGMPVGTYRNPRWQHAYRLIIDQYTREETLNIFRVANIGMDTHPVEWTVNDGIKVVLLGGAFGGLLVLIQSRLGSIKQRRS